MMSSIAARLIAIQIREECETWMACGEYDGFLVDRAAEIIEDVLTRAIRDDRNLLSMSPQRHPVIGCADRHCAYHRDIWHWYEKAFMREGDTARLTCDRCNHRFHVGTCQRPPDGATCDCMTVAYPRTET